jgi:endonuclease/exonuclease/phosphatase (EEP) superfamily protein YafD
MLIKSILGLFFAGVGVLANTYLVLRVLSGDSFLFVRLCNYFLPLFGLLAAISLCATALSRKWIIALINIPLPIFIGIAYAPLFYNCCLAHSSTGHPLKVMSYNIHQFNREMPKAADLIAEENPDILLVQEIEPHNFTKLIGLLARQRDPEPLFYEYEPSILQAVVSRFPLRRVSYSEDKNRLLKVQTITPYGCITLLNIHAFKYGWLDRHERMQRILEEDVLQERGPLILAGDFNTTDQSETFRMLTANLQDAQQEVGCGFNFSFPAQAFFPTAVFPIPPMLRIDHILHSSHFRPVRTYTVSKSGGSDHYPIVVQLTLAPAPY